MGTLRQALNYREAGAISRKAFLAVVALMFTMAASFTAGNAEAANRFAVVGLENTTHVTIRVQHKWGDGGWKEDVIQPGARKWFWWTYSHANDNKSPPFNVKFDSDLQPGKVFTINYHLKKNAAPAHEWENARKYVFKYDGNRKYIDLYDGRG